MKISDLLIEVTQRLDPKCWKGKKIGNPKTKIKGGVRVNNCVPKESTSLDEGPFTKTGNWLMKRKLEKDIKQHGKDLDNDSKKFWLSGSGLPPWHPDEYREPVDPTFNWGKTASDRARKAKLLQRLSKLKQEVEEVINTKQSVDVCEDWQKVNKKDKTSGMSRKAVKAYRREHPGSKLQTAVTTKPSKLKKGSKASKRRKSFCARSNGQKKMHHIDCSKTPDKAICKARRRWNCEE